MTQVFWTTLFGVPLILAIATLLGRALTSKLPFRLRARSRFYLAPAFGLALLMVSVAVMGRYVPLGASPWPVALVGLLVVVAFIMERRPGQLLQHIAVVSLFAFVAGAGLLASIYLFAAFNPHNDTFTYLAISDWLQRNPFDAIIPRDAVTPLSTQAALYQFNGFRMGASLLMALFQALINASSALQIYPGTVMVATATAGLALGLPLSGALPRARRWHVLLLSAIPSLSLGGVAFAGYFGFLPQLYGVGFGAAYLFVLNEILLRPTRLAPRTFLALVLAALLCAASALSYSELLPLLVATSVTSALLSGVRQRQWLYYVIVGLVVAVLLLVFLNVEIPRTYQALVKQSGAVVGGPVPWPVWGMMAHALGIHGGAWDALQWSRADQSPMVAIAGYSALVVITAAVAVSMAINGRKIFWRTNTSLTAVAIFGAAILFFRYGVANPFDVGTGQSWSQFKLTEWVQPFVFVACIALLAAGLAFRRRSTIALSCVVVVLGGYSITTNVARLGAIWPDYGGSDIETFFANAELDVEAACGPYRPLYLDLPWDRHKMRQMLAWAFADREVRADWTGDSYIYRWLPEDTRAASPRDGDCIIGVATEATPPGHLSVDVWNGGTRVAVTRVEGQHPLETDENTWWVWVDGGVDIGLNIWGAEGLGAGSNWSAEIVSLSSQTITIKLELADGTSIEHVTPVSPGGQVVQWSTGPLKAAPVAVAVTGDGAATSIGPGDQRQASFLVRGMQIVPVAGQ